MTSAPTAGAIGEIDERLKLGARIAGDEDDPRACLARPRQSAAHELRHSAGGHADHDVLLGRPEPGDRTRAFLVVVLDTFLGGERRVLTTRHDRLDERRLGAEGRRHLGRFQNAKATARAGADKHDAAVLAQRGRDHLDAHGDPLPLALHGREHLAVFADHQVDDFAGRQLVDAKAGRVDRFGGQRLPFRTHHHRCRASSGPL